jgi:arylsulfatase A-like enzyme
MAKKRPNIVVLMSDQQRLDTVGAYGLNDVCKTPHIDALAARGMRFDSAFTPTAICSPARASFYTGLYPHKHGVTGNGLCLQDDVKGVNHYLQEAGYTCGYAGKWHVDEKKGPSGYGFTGQDFLGYAFPGSGLLPGLQFGAKPHGHNPYAIYKNAVLRPPFLNAMSAPTLPTKRRKCSRCTTAPSNRVSNTLSPRKPSA